MTSRSKLVQNVRQIFVAAAIVALMQSGAALSQSPPVPDVDFDAVLIREKLNVTDFDLQSIQVPNALQGVPVSAVIELGGNTLTLELWPHSVRSADYQLFSRGIGGKLTPLLPPPPRTYRGWIKDVPGSGVAVSIINNGQLLGQIVDGQSTWWVQPLDRVIPGADRTLHATYRSADLAAGDWRCGLDTSKAQPADPINDGGVAGPTDPGCPLVAKIAIDSDFEFYQLNGSNPGATVLDIEAVLDQVNFIYERDVQIRHELATAVIVQQSEPDPYSSTNYLLLLNEFENYWNANHTDIERDVAHLMTGKEIDGTVIGVANFAAICYNDPGPCCADPDTYGLSESLFSTNLGLRARLTAHELGHNWGAPHCTEQQPGDPPLPCEGTTCNVMCWSINGCCPNSGWPTCALFDEFESCSRDSIIAFRDLVSACLDSIPPGPVAMSAFVPADGVADDIFGTSVALDGELAIVGAYGDDFENEEPEADVENAGSAYVFRFDKATGTWAFEAKLTASDSDDQDRFGVSVDIVDHADGTEFAVIGAYGQDVPELNGGSDTRGAGAVYVFRNVGGQGPGSSWVEEAKLTAEDFQNGDNLGRSVAAVRGGSTDFVLASAHLDDTPLNAGAVYVFRGDSQVWEQEDKIRAVDLTSGDQFGSSLDAVYDSTGNIMAVIGASFDNDDVTGELDLGSVYIFMRNFPTWMQVTKLRSSDRDPHPADFFGFSSRITIGATGPTVIVGAPNVDLENKEGPVLNAGAAYIFADSGLGWTPVGSRITAPEFQANDRFGNAVAIHQDTALVGAPADDNPLFDSGSAHMFEFDGSTWVHQSAIAPGNPGEDNEFGFSVAVHSDHFLIGAWQYDVSLEELDNGAVYFGEEVEPTDCNGNGVFDPCDIRNGTSQDVNKNGIPDECDPPPTGGCCAADLACTVTSAADCATAGGTYLGDDTVCLDPNPCARVCIGDISPVGGDGAVNVNDLLAIISNWGACQTPPTACPADIAPPGGDGVVNVNDLLAIISHWGPCP